MSLEKAYFPSAMGKIEEGDWALQPEYGNQFRRMKTEFKPAEDLCENSL